MSQSSKPSQPPRSLTEMLDRLAEAGEGEDEVAMETLMEAVGRRSFGPMLLLVGVALTAPGLADIPGVSTLVGLFVLLVSGQLLFGREHFWLPQWMLRRKLARKTLEKMTGSSWIRRPARWIDAVLRERLPGLIGRYPIAVASTVLGLAMPLTEFIPLSGIGVGLGFLAFGLALIGRDGAMALAGFAIAGLTLTLGLFGIS